MNNFTLGLDLGTSSIGWAILGHNGNDEHQSVTGCGVRIFQEVTDAKTKTPKNQARRNARSSRRLISRRKMRRNSLLNLLVQKRLLPEDAVEREKFFSDNKQFDPYQLRKKALNDKLTTHELGRVLYHLNQRRGFQSNRKTKSKDEGEVKTAILSLRQDIEASGCRTLGEYLAGQSKKRERYTDRAMYQEEFEKIWKEQQKYYPEILSPAFKVTLHNTIFFQRPLKLQKNLVGKCTFELSRKRAARALLEAQRFRILQDLNNLTVKNPITRDFRQLTKEERIKMLTILEKQKTLSWNKARKVLKIHEGETFNLEEGKKKELIGNRTAFALSKILGGQWDKMPQDKQNTLITDMLTIDNTQGFLNRMTSHWAFDSATAEKLAETELEPGYMRLSRKAMCRILPHLEQGMKYDEACKTAGYDHSNPDLKMVTDELTEPPYLRNPVVQKALHETRKLINAIIREYGKPETIRIEMARDMKLTKKQKERLQKEQNTRKKENDKARAILKEEFKMQQPTREDIQKYNLWIECKMTCPYTNTVISKEMLFSPETEIEHILPYSRSLDDSYMNKTLGMSYENKIKHNKTPYEAYGTNQEKYLDILQRVKALPSPKRRRFEQKEIDTEKFIERQLNDTRYICTEVKQYLQQLGVNVEISKGEATATLRYRWGLNGILSTDGFMEKNREDHRHHAIDAVVIALTDKGLFHKLSRLSAQSGEALSSRKFYLEKPWQNFYEDVKGKIESIVVSHAPSRKISGALHEATAYSYDEHHDCYVYRVPLSKITEKMIENIRDKKVKELVMQRLEKYEGDSKKAFGNNDDPLLHADGKTPIRSVRINKKAGNVYPVKLDGKAYKFFELGSNHHVEIIENIQTGKREGRFVTTMEAARRARIDKTAIVQRNHGEDWRFIMSLAINDMVEIEEVGIKRYYRVQKMSDPTITMRLHIITATSDTDHTGVLRKSPNTLCCRKVLVDSLGTITPCND